MRIKAEKQVERLSISEKLKKLLKSSFLIIIGGLSAYFSILAIFAFRNIPYLSDATFVMTEWPFLFSLSAIVFLLINYYLFSKKKTKPRKVLIILSMLSIISIGVNLIVYAATTNNDDMNFSYSEIIDNGDTTTFDNNEGTFMAGAAKGDITPSKNMMPMPLLSVLKFRDIRDHVYARALAMSDGTDQYLYITLDMTLVPEAEETLAFISEQTGIPEKNILISATHTHGVTPISLIDYINPIDKGKSEKWYEEIKQTLIATIAEAQLNMVPAKYGYGEGQSDINVNRDIVVGEKSILGSNFDRPSDKTLRMVRIEDMDGKMISLLVNHATHSVVMNGAISGPGTSLTGDLSGRTSSKIEAQLNDDAVVLWNAGAAADQNPRITAQYVELNEDNEPKKTFVGKKASSILLEYLSDEHVRDILEANKTFEATETDPLIYSAEKTIMVDSLEEGKKQPYKLHVFTLGDIAFEGVSAEIVTSIGKAIKEVSPFENTILVTLANGYEGYVADDWQYEHEAFEAEGSKAKKGAAEKELIKGFTELFNDIPHER